MTTILGYHISTIRPLRPYQPKVYKDELPRATYQTDPKTIDSHSGKVTACCVKLVSGGIRSVSTPSTHLRVLEVFGIEPEHVQATGWLLENGNYIWR